MKYNLLHCDVYAGLIHLKENSIDVAITSPPYWNQRDYGFEGQIGNEPTYQDYIFKLVKIFNVLRTRLKKNGVFFLNVGDKYLSKYGKSPLGFIPYKLAYEMVKDGWYLNDIIIWYKPNHMPSSIKNRFTNTYEPVFVLSPSKKNIFCDNIKKNKDYTNILKINLQPTPYKHVAVYPERLVEELLKMVNLNDKFTVLDPFAGSGTTLKVVKEKYPKASAFMIESNKDYIDIIIERCGLKNNYTIKKYDFIPYQYDLKYSKVSTVSNEFSEQLSLFEKFSQYDPTTKEKGLVKITDNKNEYYKLLDKFENHSIKNNLSSDCLCFIGSKDFDIELIIRTSMLNEMKWVIRNMIVVQKDKFWFPIFMIVDDNKFADYLFNYQKLNLKPRTNNDKKWQPETFIGYSVFDSVSKNSNEGLVVDILETYENNFPKYVIVKWKNDRYTKEFVILNHNEINQNIRIKSYEPLIIDELVNYVDLNKELISYSEKFVNKIEQLNNTVKNYNGKFKDEKRKNWGASPGARASVMNEYFSMQRLYNVDQKLVSKYLNQKRVEKGLTKSDFIKLFPESYKHTVGHWLRSDFGGSIPTPEDWKIIETILDIEPSVTKYVCSTALKLQTVTHSQYKMPDDFIDYSFIPELKKLYEP
ncbi:MAG: site-specific DNA-methyltransferase [Melioribacteraceae bacterium]